MNLEIATVKPLILPPEDERRIIPASVLEMFECPVDVAPDDLTELTLKGHWEKGDRRWIVCILNPDRFRDDNSCHRLGRISISSEQILPINDAVQATSGWIRSSVKTLYAMESEKPCQAVGDVAVTYRFRSEFIGSMLAIS